MNALLFCVSFLAGFVWGLIVQKFVDRRRTHNRTVVLKNLLHKL